MPLRLAFLGIDHPHGAHWRQQLANFAGEAQIVAFVPSFGGGAASLEEHYAGLPRFDSVNALLSGVDFDAAVVCLSNRDGPPAIAELARAGKHVVAEKPVAATANDARQIAEAVERSGIAFQTGYMWRYDDIANRLKRMVEQGAFGKLISVEMTFVTSDIARRGPDHYLFDPAASGSGFFSWLACHWLDTLLFVTGKAVVGVTARTGVFGAVPTKVEDGGVAIFDLEDGSIATFLGGYWHPRWAGESRWAIRGSQRWVHWDAAKKGTGGVLEIHGPQPQWHAMEDIYASPADSKPGYGGDKGFLLVHDWL
ncbi:MAG TPA: Gfo/Idh/MocA family oxidoreductase, partial [Pirellulaceae bacterium]|nr:Gfo/Idh/MocA family oxidoreductase [Pirellulaceae bacterium]